MVIFRRKKRNKEIEKYVAYCIISAVCKELPEEFNYLSLQFNEGLIQGVSIQTVPFYKNGYRNFSEDIAILNRYEDRKKKRFTIDNIFISDLEHKIKYKVSIEIVDGVFTGYTIEVTDIQNVDVNTIDAKGFKINYQENPLEKLFTNNELRYLNPSEIYEVELENKIYYHLFDLEDGDFIGMDEGKKVYEMGWKYLTARMGRKQKR